MVKFIGLIAAMLGLSALLSGCSLFCWLCNIDKPLPTIKVMPGTPEMFSGQVVSNFGEKVSGATVRVNGQSTATDAEGRFQLPALLAWRYVVSIEKDGHGLYARTFQHGVERQTWTLTKASVVENLDPLSLISVEDKQSSKGCQGLKRQRNDWTRTKMYAYRAKLSDREKLSSLSSSASAPTTCASGIKVSIPAGVLQFEDGKALTIGDPVTVSVATVELFAPDSMPGDFTFVERTEGRITRSGFMQSYGAGSVTITSKGRPLRIASGKKAQLTIPIDPNVRKHEPPPETIPLLSYDEQRAVWVHEGTATLDATKSNYVADVTHFTAYNADVEFLNPACVALNTSPIGHTVDIYQHVFDAASNDYHPKWHPGIPPGTHAFYALPPIMNSPPGTNAGHTVVLEVYDTGCNSSNLPSCNLIDVITVPDPSINPNLPLQSNVPPVQPSPMGGYADCHYSVATFQDPASASKPYAVDADPSTPSSLLRGVVKVSWNHDWDNDIASHPEDGFEVEECQISGAGSCNIASPSLSGGWSYLETTAKDGDVTTTRLTIAKQTGEYPRAPSAIGSAQYKYRVRAYYGTAAANDTASPPAIRGYTAWSDDIAANPEAVVTIGDASLVVDNQLAYATGNYDDVWVLRLRINKTAGTVAGQLMFGAGPEKMEADNQCFVPADGLRDGPPLSPPVPVTTSGYTLVNMNGNLPNYYLYIGLGSWGLGSQRIHDGWESLPTCGAAQWAKRMLSRKNVSTPYFHRSVGGSVELPNVPDTSPSIVAGTNYLAVQDHFSGPLRIVISGSANAPMVEARDQYGDVIGSASLDVRTYCDSSAGCSSVTDPVSSPQSP